MTNIVIVESPAKAKTIGKYLGPDYKVMASYGHVRDLPSKDGSVRPDEDFAMDYEISDGAKKYINNIVSEVKGAKKIFLASDPDREGEAIAWHIVEALKEKSKSGLTQDIKRIVFSEITKDAVQNALQSPRGIDMDLVNAQQARRALDYLVGFNISPLLWRKLPGCKSAGRVQSVALRLICQREEDIEAFRTQEYWDITGNFSTGESKKFDARLTSLNGKKLEKFDLPNESEAKQALEQAQGKNYNVDSVERKILKRNPYAPFITSSLQQEASRKLGFTTKKTMQVAQKLYEGVSINGEVIGLITYMRTDGVQLSQMAINAVRDLIKSKFGENYLPKSPRVYKTKAKNAQEAHEAIRPTNVHLSPNQLNDALDKDQLGLYELIWKRTIACQMQSAELNIVSVKIKSEDNNIEFRASGSTLKFDGFYRLYKEGTDDGEDEDGNKMLPPMEKGENLGLNKLNPAQHFTDPPPRYTEASLVKKMEELGIGRPSTYAAIISVLQDREYVKLEKKRFKPEDRGRIVTAFLNRFFKKYVQYDFTAELEDDLDLISNGKMKWKDLLQKFWDDFHLNTEEVKDLKNSYILDEINDSLENYLFPKENDNEDARKCPSCENGRLSLKTGKFGAFIACSDYPECKYTRQVSAEGGAQEGGAQEASEDIVIGKHEKEGLDIILKNGPYGHYLQLGENNKENKPKRVTLPKGLSAEEVTLDKAHILIALPMELGKHPNTGDVIKLGIGKFGPFVHCAGKYTSLRNPLDILNMDVDKAASLIDSSTSKAKNEPLRVIGKSPEDNEDIAIFDGRYGPYIKHNRLNAPFPKNLSIEDITIEQAIEILVKRKETVAQKKKKK